MHPRANVQHACAYIEIVCQLTQGPLKSALNSGGDRWKAGTVHLHPHMNIEVDAPIVTGVSKRGLKGTKITRQFSWARAKV